VPGPVGDALFGLGEAVLCAGGPVTSLPRLSLLPALGRGHGSVYAALAEGRIDAGGLRDLLVAYRLAGWPLVFAVDGTSWPRCDAETSPQRGYYYHPSRHSAGKPIVAGWWYQQVSQLNFGKDSWTWPVVCRRVRPLEDHVAATAGQVRDLLGRLVVTAAVPLFVFDGGYDPIALADELAGENAQLLVRIKGDRVFYADPPSRAPGGKGRPRRHGTRFDCKKPVTGRAGRRRSQGSGRGQVGTDVVVGQRPVGVHGDLSAEQVGGGALELEHVEQVPVGAHVAPEPAGGGEGQMGNAVPSGEVNQLSGVQAHLLLGRVRQVRRLGQWLTHPRQCIDTADPQLMTRRTAVPRGPPDSQVDSHHLQTDRHSQAL
jgi:hypothetical protein